MVLSSSHAYSLPNPGHNPSTDFNEFGQYLELTLPPFPNIDFVESQQQELRSAPGQVPGWPAEFMNEDFLLFESDGPQSQAGATSVSETSSPVKVDTSSTVDAVPLFALPSETVPISIDSGFTDNTDIDRWLFLTDSGELDLGMILGSNVQDPNQNVMEQIYSLFDSSSENALGEELHPPSPDRSISPQNDDKCKIMIPRMPCVICSTCKLSLSSESQLRKHLRTHSRALFTCEVCNRAFKLPKDLKRHMPTHELKPQRFACSCGSKYSRQDGVFRHVTTMAKIDTEADHHQAVKSISK